jgi:hypothetical protein
MGTISGVQYPKTNPNDSIDRAPNGVFSNGWECFKRDWESLKLDWKPVERELKTMDRQSQERFMERAKEASLRLKAIIGSE